MQGQRHQGPGGTQGVAGHDVALNDVAQQILQDLCPACVSPCSAPAKPPRIK